MIGVPRIFLLSRPRIARIFRSHERSAPHAHFQVWLTSGCAFAGGLCRACWRGCGISRNGDRVTIQLSRDPAEAKQRWLAALDELRELPKPPSIQKRERFEIPDRPGL